MGALKTEDKKHQTISELLRNSLRPWFTTPFLRSTWVSMDSKVQNYQTHVKDPKFGKYDKGK